MQSTLPAREANIGVAPRGDDTGTELKRGAFLNTIAVLTANFRAVFTLLVARLLGPIALGVFSVAWATTDLLSKLGVLGLDDAVTTFVARAEAVGDQLRSRALFRLTVVLAVVQSAAVAAVSIVVIRLLGSRLSLEPEMLSALAVIVCAMPGIALYRISNSVSRGMKVMKHDIYSRGITDSGATTLAFLIAFALGMTTFAPEVAAIAGTTASGIVGFVLASRLFRHLPKDKGVITVGDEARQLLGYALPISADQFLNAFIWRLDVIMLGWFVNRVPGVTLTTLGIYGAVIGVANGLRKVSQAFTPIFAPVVAGMTATGQHERAAATYARLAQWMLWILLPLVAVMVLAAGTILRVFGSAFQQGGMWLEIVALGCATNAFINLGEIVIMVQRPRLNLLVSAITCAAGVCANLWLIPRFGVIGAAFGLLFAYLLQGVLRDVVLRVVFRWPEQWSSLAPPAVAALIALAPALVCRFLLGGNTAQVSAAIIFLVIFGAGWKYRQLRVQT